MSFITTTRISLLSVIFGLTTLNACSDQSIPEAAALDADATSQNTFQEESRAPEVARNTCITCGTVRAITAVTEEGESTGVGAALGAIVGGIAGHQVGGGTGKKIATVAGAVGGAVAGNEIEKNRGTDLMYDVRIEMDNGSEQTIRVPDAAGIKVGSEVTVEGNQISLR